ncbi:MAG: PD-(D/E)XK nuclease family protein [Bacilli bacterium]|nr:PD-(D/E)XK nuclease family protein [Bacilli bacterium]
MQKLTDLIVNSDRPVVIASAPVIKKLVKALAHYKTLINISYKTFKEATDDILGSWRPEARIRLRSDLNISPEYAEILLKNSLLAQPGINRKIDELVTIRQTYNAYLDYQELTLNLYRGRTVVIVGDYYTDDSFNQARNIISRIAAVVSYLPAGFVYKKIPIYRFSDYKEEILYLGYEVASLLNQGIAPEKIKIHRLPSSYRPYFNEVFTLLGIEYTMVNEQSLSEYEVVKRICADLAERLDEPLYEAFAAVLAPYNNGENPVIAALINVFNRYLVFDYRLGAIYQDLCYTLTQKKLPVADYQGVVRITDLPNEIEDGDDYLFIPALNQDIFPRACLNDDYLDDDEKRILGLIPSRSINSREKAKVLDLINRANRIYLSYPRYAAEGKMAKSSVIADLKLRHQITEKDYPFSYNISYSRSLDIIRLGKCLDLYYKYDIKEEPLYTLLAAYPDHSYRSYKSNFTGLTPEFYQEILPSPLILSYTSLDKYYKCGFLFYLEKILKINRIGNEAALYIGNLFHYCLEKIFQEQALSTGFDQLLDDAISTFLEENNKILTKKEEYFLKKYRFVLKKLYGILSLQKENSDFTVYGLEKDFSIPLGDGIILKGKIDKIMTAAINGKPYAMVLDYKSGNLDLDLNRVFYGLNMQLALYFYFLNNSADDKFNFAGAYLQRVLPNSVFPRVEGKTYEEQWEEFFRLYGYSNINPEILRHIDHNYDTNEQKFLAGIRVNKDGSFHRSDLSKLLSDEEFTRLTDLVADKINNAKSSLLAASFPINPKKLGSYDSCSYCPYRDICFREESDYQELKTYRNFEFIREEI